MYKVLRREDGKLVSCVIGRDELSGRSSLEYLKKWQLTYYPNRWKKAKLGKVIICKTLEVARGVYRAENADEIWKCEAENVVQIKELLDLRVMSKYFNKFWRCLAIFTELLFPPFPTYGADRIKLTKKVWPK